MKAYSLQVSTAFPKRGSPWEKLQHLVSIAGPIGFIPWVPATFASLATAAVCWWHPPSATWVLALSLLLLLVGAQTATVSERLLAAHDPRNVVVDEVLGQLLTFLFLAPVNRRIALAGFLLFRLFDVAKPFPARSAERFPAGWGIMTDDLVAGLYAALVLYLLRTLLR